MSKPDPTFKDFKPWEKLLFVCICLFWVAIAVIFVIYSKQANRENAEYQNAYEMVSRECEQKRVASNDYSPEGSYNLYHDAGPNKAPTCRHPKNSSEIDDVVRQRQYRQQLENGDVEPDSLDENCYNSRVCQ